MNAEKYLEGYRQAQARINRIESEIDDLDAKLDAIGGTSDGLPRSTIIRSRTEDLAIMISDRRKSLLEEKIKAEEERNEVFDTIQRMEEVVESDVLYWRYIKSLGWDEIAEKVHYSRYWTQVYWRRGLSIIEKMITTR